MPNPYCIYVLNIYNLLTHSVDKIFQRSLANFNIRILIKHQSFVCTQLSGYKYVNSKCVVGW